MFEKLFAGNRRPKSSADWSGVIGGLRSGLEALAVNQSTLEADRDSLALDAVMGDQGAQERLAATENALTQNQLQARSAEASLAAAHKKLAEAERTEQAAAEVRHMQALHKAITDRERFLVDTFQPAAVTYAEAIAADLKQRHELASATGVEFVAHRHYSTALVALAKELNQRGVDYCGTHIGMERFDPDALKDAIETSSGKPWMRIVENAIQTLKERHAQPAEAQ
ncbi:hypothetical protein [uncultured Thiocystis sp.]|jgi:hypothetical protein|uniref:hypothetical protein n=1 Tax=uncultured Thiocystis sp. TaxID=1202134 RepID=UPI0025EA429C|nr:hypothetical protein [uncultured Thiocystis sp.]